MRDRVFYSICFGFVFGVLLRSFLTLDFYLSIAFCLISLGLILFFSLVSWNKWGIITGVFILAFSLGILRFQIADTPSPKVFESQVGQKVSFSGEIVNEPDKRENNQKLTIESETGGKKTKILVATGLDTNFKYGDKVNFTGKLEKPENFVTDQGKNFDYINYLRKDGIHYVMNYVTQEIISHGHGNKLKSFLFSVKDKFLNATGLAIYHPESLLMGGLILGERSAFENQLRQKFIDTGTIHIVALSG